MKNYSLGDLKSDFLAGLIVALVALPLAMSFAIAIGVRPEYGLIAAIIGGIAAAFFGGSEMNVTGPTGAFIAILGTIVVKFGYQDLLIAGFMAGIILFLAGVFRFGKLIEFIPYPVTIGFTGGIAVIIASSQLSNVLGLEGLTRYEFFHENIIEIFSNIPAANLITIGIAVFTIILMWLLPKLNGKIPAALIAVIFSAVAVELFGLKVSTIASVFGEIPNTLPPFTFPEISFHKVVDLLPAAFSIAILGAIESLLSCVVADGMTRKNHNSNSELIGQGIANVVTPFFGGIPVTGAIARTAVNVKSGAKTRFASIFHALFLLLMMIVFAPLVGKIPLAALGGILLVVSFRMAEVGHMKDLLVHADRQDKAVLLCTLLLTIFTDLTISIPVGISLSALLFIKGMSEMGVSPTVVDRKQKEPHFVPTSEQLKCPHIAIYTIEGPLFFGAARKLVTVLKDVTHAKSLILRLQHVPVMDATGINALREIISHHSGYRDVYLTGIQKQVMDKLEALDVLDSIGRERILPRTKDAINKALRDQGLKKGCEEFSIIE